MSEENLGRVQGAGFYYSTASSSTSVDIATLYPSTIKPVYGDNIIFANGDVRNITAVSDTAVTCGGVVANLQGPDGVRIVSSELQGQDTAGGNIYLQTFSDGTTATFTAPRGLEGLGILYSSAVADADTAIFAKDSLIIPAGREVKIGDIIFSNAHLFSVNAVSETSFSVTHLAYFSTDSAYKDGAGNVIVDTYATKTQLTDGTITVKLAKIADEAVYAGSAGSAINDGDGNDITETYATKTQLTDGSVTKVGTSTVGSSTKPIYLNEGVPTAGTYTLGAACAKSVSDSSSASAISSTDTNVPTVRDIYYGLPKFNNDHTYTSTKSFYAPESGGTAGYYLKSNGSTTAPSWIDPGRRSWYGVCPTTGNRPAKEVNDIPDFVLETGAKVSVRFTYENIASSPTLNINSTGAKSIRNSRTDVGTLTYRWYPGQVVDFIYDGTYWLLQQPVVATTTYYGASKVASLTLNGLSNATPSFYAPTVDTGGRWLRGTGWGEPEWSLPINIQDSYTEISSNQTVPDLGVGHTGVICYFTSHSSPYTIYLPSSGEWSFAFQVSNSYYNEANGDFSSAKSVAWRDSSVSGGTPMCQIRGNGKYTSVMIIYTRTK